MKTLITNIKQLVQTEKTPRKWVAGKDMAQLETISHAYLLVEGEKIAAFGPMEELDREEIEKESGILKEECEKILQDFFKELRKKKNNNI